MQKNKNEILLIVGNSISQFGNVIFSLSLNWWLVKITNSASLLAFVATVSFVPQIILNLFNGVIVDRLNKKKILVITDLLSGILCILLGVFTDINNINVMLVIIINIGLGVCYSLFSPATRSIIPDIISSNRIKKVNSILSSLNSLIKIVSPLIGGILFSIDFIGFKGIFIINGITFLVSALMEFLLNYNYLSNKYICKKSLFGDFIDGFTYLKKETILLRLLITSSLVNFFIAGYNILLPFIAKKIYENNYIYSIFLSSEALGGIIGSISLYVIKKDNSNLKEIIRELVFCSISFSFILIPNEYLMIFSVFLFGLFLTRFNITFFTYVQTNTEKKMLGRVFSFIFTTAIVLMPIGNLFFGLFGDYNLISSYLFIGIGIFSSTLLLNKRKFSIFNGINYKYGLIKIKTNSRILVFFVGLVIGLVIPCVIFYFYNTINQRSEEPIQILDYTGKNIEEAMTSINPKIKVNQIWIYNNTMPKGYIIDQKLSREIDDDANDYVEFTVSNGPLYFKMFDLIGMDWDKGCKLLEDIGIEFEILFEYNHDFEYGKISRTEPDSSSNIKYGDIIKVYISQGSIP